MLRDYAPVPRLSTGLLTGLALSVLLLWCLAHAEAAPQAEASAPVHNLELIGQAGGAFKAIAVQEPYVYAAIGPRLAVLDVTDASQPTRTGQTDVLSFDIYQLAVQDSTVYATSHTGLHLFDVTDPARPVLTASLSLPGVVAFVAITGTHAFVATDSQLHIVDISQPSTPQVVYSYPAAVQDVAFDGNLLLLALGDSLRILDISNPAAPVLVTDYSVAVDEVEAQGQQVYVVDNPCVTGPFGSICYAVLRILDLSNLPTVQERFASNPDYPGNFSRPIYEMQLLQGRLYGYEVVCGRAPNPCTVNFISYDISNPDNPTLAAAELYSARRRDTYYQQFQFTVTPQRVYATFDEVLRVLTATGAEVGRYHTWPADGLAVAEGTAFVAGRAAGLVAMDLSTPDAPTVRGVYTTAFPDGGDQPGQVVEISLYGPYLYQRVWPMGWGSRVHQIVDTSQPGRMQQVSSAQWDFFPAWIHRGYGYSYDLVSNYRYLRSIDLGDPLQPMTTTSTVTTRRNATGLLFADRYAYVPAQDEGLHIIDIANPQQMSSVWAMEQPIPALAADSGEGALYIFTDSALKIYDLMDPTTPVQAGSTSLPDLRHLKGAQVVGEYVYLAQRYPERITLRGFHVPNRAAPAREVFSYTLPIANSVPVGEPALHLAVQGDLLVLAAVNDGLFVFRHTIDQPNLNRQLYLPLVDNQSSPFHNSCSVTYRAHLQEKGWMGWTADGDTAGAAGQGLRLEAVQLDLCDDLPAEIELVYQAHVQDIGWMDWVYTGEIVGTIGEQKRLEAIRIKLLNPPEQYAVTYRVFVEGSGWSESVSDGAVAGTIGQNKRLEAIQVVISHWGIE
ncbi:MAG: hypothetical protein WBO46_15410 [Caldilineaceae bacterium]